VASPFGSRSQLTNINTETIAANSKRLHGERLLIASRIEAHVRNF
jgi:hypothetical protein